MSSLGFMVRQKQPGGLVRGHAWARAGGRACAQGLGWRGGGVPSSDPCSASRGTRSSAVAARAGAGAAPPGPSPLPALPQGSDPARARPPSRGTGALSARSGSQSRALGGPKGRASRGVLRGLGGADRSPSSASSAAMSSSTSPVKQKPAGMTSAGAPPAPAPSAAVALLAATAIVGRAPMPASANLRAERAGNRAALPGAGSVASALRPIPASLPASEQLLLHGCGHTMAGTRNGRAGAAPVPGRTSRTRQCRLGAKPASESESESGSVLHESASEVACDSAPASGASEQPGGTRPVPAAAGGRGGARRAPPRPRPCALAWVCRARRRSAGRGGGQWRGGRRGRAA